MIKLRRSDDRGHTKLNWLDSRHTFSFDDYYEPQYRGFRDLRGAIPYDGLLAHGVCPEGNEGQTKRAMAGRWGRHGALAVRPLVVRPATLAS